MFKLDLATTKGKYKVMHVKTPQDTKSEPIWTSWEIYKGKFQHVDKLHS